MFHVVLFKTNLSRIVVYSAYLAVLIFFFTGSVACQTIQNFGQWKNMSSIYKSVYVSGVIDEKLSPSCENCTNFEQARSLRNCLKDLKITILEIVTMIDNFYINVENWRFDPQKAIDYQLLKGHCFTYLTEKD